MWAVDETADEGKNDNDEVRAHDHHAHAQPLDQEALQAEDELPVKARLVGGWHLPAPDLRVQLRPRGAIEAALARQLHGARVRLRYDLVEIERAEIHLLLEERAPVFPGDALVLHRLVRVTRRHLPVVLGAPELGELVVLDRLRLDKSEADLNEEVCGIDTWRAHVAVARKVTDGLA